VCLIDVARYLPMFIRREEKVVILLTQKTKKGYYGPKSLMGVYRFRVLRSGLNLGT